MLLCGKWGLPQWSDPPWYRPGFSCTDSDYRPAKKSGYLTGSRMKSASKAKEPAGPQFSKRKFNPGLYHNYIEMGQNKAFEVGKLPFYCLFRNYR